MKLTGTHVLIIGIAWLLYLVWLVRVSPRSPDAETGHVWAVPSHGVTVYVTVWEYAIALALPVLAALIALAGGLRRKR